MNPPEVKYLAEQISPLDQPKVKYLAEQISPLDQPKVKYLAEQISPLDQPKVKYLAEQISPNGTKYDRQIMEKHKAAVMSSHLQTFEYNHQPQGVPNNIYPCSPIHHLLPSNT